MDTVITLLERFGFSTAALIVTIWLLVRGAKVVWADVVIPFRDTLLKRTVTFFDRLDSVLDQTLARHAETITSSERNEELCVRILDAIEEVKASCSRISERTRLASWTAPRQQDGDHTPASSSPTHLPPPSS